MTVPHPKRVHPITESANGKKVYADLIQAPLAVSVGRNPFLLRLAEDALKTKKLTGPAVELEIDTGRNIGYSELTTTTDTDVVFYAHTTKTSGYTRFVKNHRAQPTQFITISLVADDEGDYEITNIWIGKAYPAMPDDMHVEPNNKAFWSNHAVIYNGQAVIASTITKTCPF